MIADSPDDAMGMVNRLIGPVGPELSCDECFDLLDVYVELEQGGGDAGALMPAMRAHLLGCSVCRDDHESLRALINLVVPGHLRRGAKRCISGRLINSKLVHLCSACQHLAPPGDLELLDAGVAPWNISKQQKTVQLGHIFPRASMFCALAL